MADGWIDLNLATNHCPDASLVDALSELVMNAIDAAPGKTPKLDVEDGTVVLEDEGPGLRLASFVVGGTTGENKVIGRFGLGLKDAIAVLMRNQVKIEIRSKLGGYHFDERVGQCGTETIHVCQRKRSGEGVRVELVGLPEKTVNDVKERFLCFAEPPELHCHENVVVMAPADGQEGRFFVNGVKVVFSQPLHLSYNIINPTSKQRRALTRDHTITSGKTKLFRVPMEAALLSGRSKLAGSKPDKPSCEFAWPDVRAHFFGPLPQRPMQSHRKSVQTRVDTPPPQPPTLNEQLHELAALGPLPPLVKPAGHNGRLSEEQRALLAQSVSTLTVDKLIDAFSEDDAVPRTHEKVVDELTKCLQACNGLSVDKVYPGGSYGKRTNIGEHSDVDLLVVLNGLPTENHERWLHLVLSHLRVVVEKKFPEKCRVIQVTRFAVQLQFDGVEVDLLPVPEELWNVKDRIAKVSEVPIENCPWLSVVFAEEQVKFVKQAKGDATGVIRLIKHWVKQQKWSSGCKPKSYCIELIVIYILNEKKPKDNDDLMLNFWRHIASPGDLCVCWDAKAHPDIAKERPLVLDPANSTNNVAGSFNWEEWQLLAQKICDSKLETFFQAFTAMAVNE